MIKKPKICPTCFRSQRRSIPQNSRYWKLVGLVAMCLECEECESVYLPAEAWHLFFKKSFLGYEEIELPSGEIETVLKSSAKEGSPGFNEYMTKVEAWAAERGVWLED